MGVRVREVLDRVELRPSRRAVRWMVGGLAGLMALEAAAVLVDAGLPPDLSRGRRSSPVALDTHGAWLRALPVDHGRWRIRADLARTDPSFVRRLIALEDARFDQHAGVDPLAVVRAAGSAALRGRVTSGASTLTMQTARLLEPRPRNIVAKLIEMCRAVQLEARLSKREILGLYLTLAPYGGNLEGVRAASLSYFGHEPETLTLGEQALLIALPQSPEARRPDRRPAAAKAARARVLQRLVLARLITSTEAAEAAADPLPHRSPFPALAWHVAGQAARAAQVDQASVVTTIDAGLQARLETLAQAAAAQQGRDTSVAVLVVDTRNQAVRAAVASAGLATKGGWIDITRALRSPGSTLKPFIYGFAFDDGILAPDTQLNDDARRFADYQPENFDHVFHGKVTAREALTFSLNMPAVSTLNRIGPAAFQARLEAAGVRLVRPDARVRDAGLALALGGEGLTLRDLAVLYSALGAGGVAKPLAWTEAEAAKRPSQRGVRIISADSTEKVLDILRETPAPAGRLPPALTRREAQMAFKTGTSYGFRDALAAGVVGHYAIVVWTGRADAGARSGMTGRDAALPLLLDVSDAIGLPRSAPRPIAPKEAPQALQTLAQASDGPHLIFPPDGAVVQVDGLGPSARGLILAARGDRLTWYVDGARLVGDPITGEVMWRPSVAGFFKVSVVDALGRKAEARVRVRSA